MQSDKLKLWLAVCRFPQLGPVRLQKLLAYFGEIDKIWQANETELKAAGLDQRTIAIFIQHRQQINPDKLLSELMKLNIQALSLDDEEYPSLLREIYDPPPVIYYRGKWPINKICLAIVGTRKISSYGQAVVKKLIPDLIKQQIVTVSGLALGVDSLVHQETITAGGQTIAVLGSGLDQENLYPSSNRYLVDKIIANDGLVISEYPPGTPPLPQHFPRRNRLIAGLAQGTLVIEGDIDSGSLITAQCALEQNREVMAVPGSIFASGSSGTNQLIKQGAKPITQLEDILECLQLKTIQQETITAFIPQTPAEDKIFNLLTSEPMLIDDLIRQSSLTAAEVSSTLSVLEVKGVVKNIGNNYFTKTI